jgi:hypothetical protein
MLKDQTPSSFSSYAEPFKCALCGDSFPTFSLLVEHLDVPHRGLMVLPIRTLLGQYPDTGESGETYDVEMDTPTSPSSPRSEKTV